MLAPPLPSLQFHQNSHHSLHEEEPPKQNNEHGPSEAWNSAVLSGLVGWRRLSISLLRASPPGENLDAHVTRVLTGERNEKSVSLKGKVPLDQNKFLVCVRPTWLLKL